MTPRYRPHRARWWLLPALLACAVPAQAALRLQVADPGLTSAEAEATRQLLEDATGRLPAVWLDSLDRI